MKKNETFHWDFALRAANMQPGPCAETREAGEGVQVGKK